MECSRPHAPGPERVAGPGVLHAGSALCTGCTGTCCCVCVWSCHLPITELPQSNNLTHVYAPSHVRPAGQCLAQGHTAGCPEAGQPVPQHLQVPPAIHPASLPHGARSPAHLPSGRPSPSCPLAHSLSKSHPPPATPPSPSARHLERPDACLSRAPGRLSVQRIAPGAELGTCFGSGSEPLRTGLSLAPFELHPGLHPARLTERWSGAQWAGG